MVHLSFVWQCARSLTRANTSGRVRRASSAALFLVGLGAARGAAGEPERRAGGQCALHRFEASSIKEHTRSRRTDRQTSGRASECVRASERASEQLRRRCVHAGNEKSTRPAAHIDRHTHAHHRPAGFLQSVYFQAKLCSVVVVVVVVASLGERCWWLLCACGAHHVRTAEAPVVRRQMCSAAAVITSRWPAFSLPARAELSASLQAPFVPAAGQSAMRALLSARRSAQHKQNSAGHTAELLANECQRRQSQAAQGRVALCAARCTREERPPTGCDTLPALDSGLSVQRCTEFNFGSGAFEWCTAAPHRTHRTCTHTLTPPPPPPPPLPPLPTTTTTTSTTTSTNSNNKQQQRCQSMKKTPKSSDSFFQ